MSDFFLLFHNLYKMVCDSVYAVTFESITFVIFSNTFMFLEIPNGSTRRTGYLALHHKQS